LRSLCKDAPYQKLVDRWEECYVSFWNIYILSRAEHFPQIVRLTGDNTAPSSLPLWASWSYQGDILMETFHTDPGFTLALAQFKVAHPALEGNWTALLGLGLALREVSRCIGAEEGFFLNSPLGAEHYDSLSECVR
jgi:hypothetical protein